MYQIVMFIGISSPALGSTASLLCSSPNFLVGLTEPGGKVTRLPIRVDSSSAAQRTFLHFLLIDCGNVGAGALFPRYLILLCLDCGLAFGAGLSLVPEALSAVDTASIC